jgi:hypothetical protein
MHRNIKTTKPSSVTHRALLPTGLCYTKDKNNRASMLQRNLPCLCVCVFVGAILPCELADTPMCTYVTHLLLSLLASAWIEGATYNWSLTCGIIAENILYISSCGSPTERPPTAYLYDKVCCVTMVAPPAALAGEAN